MKTGSAAQLDGLAVMLLFATWADRPHAHQVLVTEVCNSQHCHCALGSATVEAPSGCEVASNRLASISRLASMLITDTRKGASRRSPVTGASAISISRPSERYLISGVAARWP